MLQTLKWWQGVVEDIRDPLFIGRVRVRIFGLHTDNKEDIPLDHLPWAEVSMPAMMASVSGKGHSPNGLLKGSWVVGYFRDGDQCQEPIVMFSTPSHQKSITKNKKKGFFDHDEIYPLDDYLDQPDTNKLARPSDLNETIVRQKEDTRTTKFRLANSTDVRSEPLEPHVSEYPYNHVYETDGGHIQEFDDTPGGERYHRYHPSGSYEEIQANGSRSIRIVGDDYNILLRHKTLYVGGSCTVNIVGPAKIRCEHEADLEIHGPAKTVFHNDLISVVEGDHLNTVYGNRKDVIHGNYEIDVIGSKNTRIGGDLYLESNENQYIRSRGSVFESYDGIHEHWSGIYYAADAPRIDLNSDVAERQEPNDPNDSVSKGYGVVFGKPDLADLRPTARSEVFTHTYDTEEKIYTEEWFQEGLRSNFFTESQFFETPEIVTELPIAKPGDSDDEDYTGEFENEVEFENELRLSPNFTLGQVSSRAIVTHDYVKAQHGLSRAQIVENLKLGCENVLEPIKALYPDMIVTSAFRHADGGNISQHELGMAFDIQFREITTNKDYYERALAIAAILPSWDQFILEYKNTGTKLPWIHISYRRNDRRGMAMTFFNHQRVGRIGRLAWIKDGVTVEEKSLKPRSEIG